MQFPKGPLTDDFSPELKLGGLGRCKSVRTERWKLVHYPGQPYGELYDLQNDPYELHNLHEDDNHEQVRHELAGLLLEWLIETEDCLPFASGDRVGV